MRNGTKLRTIGSAKNATQLSRRRRARKTNAAPKTLNAPKIIEFIAPKTELPVVKAPPSQIGFPLPFLFWPAFPCDDAHVVVWGRETPASAISGTRWRAGLRWGIRGFSPSRSVRG